MSDEMAEAHRRDYAAEGQFRQLARDITALLDEHELALGFRGTQTLMDAREALAKAADHIVAVWD